MSRGRVAYWGPPIRPRAGDVWGVRRVLESLARRRPLVVFSTMCTGASRCSWTW